MLCSLQMEVHFGFDFRLRVFAVRVSDIFLRQVPKRVQGKFQRVEFWVSGFRSRGFM